MSCGQLILNFALGRPFDAHTTADAESIECLNLQPSKKQAITSVLTSSSKFSDDNNDSELHIQCLKSFLFCDNVNVVEPSIVDFIAGSSSVEDSGLQILQMVANFFLLLFYPDEKKTNTDECRLNQVVRFCKNFTLLLKSVTNQKDASFSVNDLLMSSNTLQFPSSSQSESTATTIPIVDVFLFHILRLLSILRRQVEVETVGGVEQFIDVVDFVVEQLEEVGVALLFGAIDQVNWKVLVEYYDDYNDKEKKNVPENGSLDIVVALKKAAQHIINHKHPKLRDRNFISVLAKVLNHLVSDDDDDEPPSTSTKNRRLVASAELIKFRLSYHQKIFDNISLFTNTLVEISHPIMALTHCHEEKINFVHDWSKLFCQLLSKLDKINSVIYTLLVVGGSSSSSRRIKFTGFGELYKRSVDLVTSSLSSSKSSSTSFVTKTEQALLWLLVFTKRVFLDLPFLNKEFASEHLVFLLNNNNISNLSAATKKTALFPASSFISSALVALLDEVQHHHNDQQVDSTTFIQQLFCKFVSSCCTTIALTKGKLLTADDVLTSTTTCNLLSLMSACCGHHVEQLKAIRFHIPNATTSVTDVYILASLRGATADNYLRMRLVVDNHKIVMRNFFFFATTEGALDIRTAMKKIFSSLVRQQSCFSSSSAVISLTTFVSTLHDSLIGILSPSRDNIQSRSIFSDSRFVDLFFSSSNLEFSEDEDDTRALEFDHEFKVLVNSERKRNHTRLLRDPNNRIVSDYLHANTNNNNNDREQNHNNYFKLILSVLRTYHKSTNLQLCFLFSDPSFVEECLIPLLDSISESIPFMNRNDSTASSARTDHQNRKQQRLVGCCVEKMCTLIRFLILGTVFLKDRSIQKKIRFSSHEGKKIFEQEIEARIKSLSKLRSVFLQRFYFSAVLSKAPCRGSLEVEEAFYRKFIAWSATALSFINNSNIINTADHEFQNDDECDNYSNDHQQQKFGLYRLRTSLGGLKQYLERASYVASSLSSSSDRTKGSQHTRDNNRTSGTRKRIAKAPLVELIDKCHCAVDKILLVLFNVVMDDVTPPPEFDDPSLLLLLSSSRLPSSLGLRSSIRFSNGRMATLMNLTVKAPNEAQDMFGARRPFCLIKD